MNFPFYGFNTPGLQLGENNGWMTQTYGTPLNTNVQPFADIGTAGTTNMNYQGLDFGLGEGAYNYQSTPVGTNNLSNWLSGNTDLLKAGVGLFTGGLGAWNGFQQNKLMERNMNMQASQFREQMNLSKSNYNSKLEDRQRARVASNPTAYESVDSYMKKYGAK